MKPKILLVDDNATVIKILTSILESEGFEVFSTTESTSAFDMACSIEPDIVLLDIMMPVMDGFEVCGLLKKDKRFLDTPVLILTAETDSRDLKKAFGLGAIDYIRKPADSIEVIARIKSAYRVKEYQDKLKEMALKDSLTGLYNHGATLELLEKEYARQATENGNISFVMIDIDYFKSINDNYGHIAGDNVLKEISCILSWSAGDKGTVGRYGGEEFAVIIPQMPPAAVKALCEEIRESIANYSFIAGQKSINATVSVGACSIKAREAADYTFLLKNADGALYSAKDNGRNRTEMCFLKEVSH